MGRPAQSSGWSLEVAGNRHPREMATVRSGGYRTRLIGLLTMSWPASTPKGGAGLLSVPQPGNGRALIV